MPELHDHPIAVRGSIHHTTRTLLLLSVPIAVLGMLASAAGLFLPRPYGNETALWASTARGYDAANLAVAFPALLLFAWGAWRGSLRAHLAWLGVLIYTVYVSLLDAGFVQFTGWHLLHITVLALSAAALIGGIAILDPVGVRSAFGPRAPIRAVALLMASFAVLVATTALAEFLPAAVLRDPLPFAAEAGLPTNPAQLLDLSLLLPAMTVTGVALWQGRALGYLLAVPMLSVGTMTGLAVVATQVSQTWAGQSTDAVHVTMVAIGAVLQSGLLAVMWRRGILSEVALDDALRQPQPSLALLAEQLPADR